MAEGKRPGGLTALAVLNFVFAGLGLLALLALFALVAAVDHGAHAAEMHENLEKSSSIGAGALYGLIILGIVRMAIMLAAGVGYLGQKRFLGRTLGTVYGVLALIDTALGIALVKNGFGIGTLIGLVYPVLTLILLNTTFKDDLVN
jgi:hypothetical protein